MIEVTITDDGSTEANPPEIKTTWERDLLERVDGELGAAIVVQIMFSLADAPRLDGPEFQGALMRGFMGLGQ